MAVPRRARVLLQRDRERGNAVDSLDFDALEDMARAKMSPGAFAFCAAGADDEITARENGEAWRRLRLRPRVLRDISRIDTATTLLGASVPTPLLVAPSGRHKIYHPEGEQATARGAAMAGAIYVLANNATVAFDTVAAERGNALQWFQLYLPPGRAGTEEVIDSVAEKGFRAIALTVDMAAHGWSPRAARAPVAKSPDIRHENLPGRPVAWAAYSPETAGKNVYPSTFADLEWLAKRAKVPVIVKGVLRGDDARRCVDLGARGIICSNHGGRHLDTNIATAEALPEVVDAVGKDAEVYVDGGIRRGTDVLKALALGARAVLVGRPVLWGLSLAGAEGVRDVLEHLRNDLMRAMALSGAPTIPDIGADLVAPRW
jgi:4-hydroxymandelate oxidase